MKFKPWSELKIPIDKDITKYRVEKFHHKFDDMEIFTLPSELILLNRFKTYAEQRLPGFTNTKFCIP